MATEQKLIVEIIRAKMINAKRERECASIDRNPNGNSIIEAEWRGQEIMAKQLIDILES